MKFSSSSISLLCLLVLFPITLTVGAPAVVDTDGHILRPGGSYYVLPHIWPSPGGLSLDRINKTCPQNVVQEPLNIMNGTPLRFFPENSTLGFVPESTNLMVYFTCFDALCRQPTLWRVDEQSENRFVTAGGFPENINSWFRIEKATSFAYKLVSCPTENESSEPKCEDLGIFREKNGLLLLAISENPHYVVFVKADRVARGNFAITMRNHDVV